MEKKESSTGMDETTCTGGFLSWKIGPHITTVYFKDQTKETLLKNLTESDEFRKLLCDITGTGRKQIKAFPEIEKIKEDYLKVCERYEKEQRKSNYLLHEWKDETAKKIKLERENIMYNKERADMLNRIYEIIKEVNCSSVSDMARQLKEAREYGKRLEEDNESCRQKSDRLKKSYDNVCEEKKRLSEERNCLMGLYSESLNKLAEIGNFSHNKEEMISDKVKEIELLEKDYQCQSDLAQKYREKSEKLQVKLDKASKRYGELIKQLGEWVKG